MYVRHIETCHNPSSSALLDCNQPEQAASPRFQQGLLQHDNSLQEGSMDVRPGTIIMHPPAGTLQQSVYHNAEAVGGEFVSGILP